MMLVNLHSDVELESIQDVNPGPEVQTDDQIKGNSRPTLRNGFNVTGSDWIKENVISTYRVC